MPPEVTEPRTATDATAGHSPRTRLQAWIRDGSPLLRRIENMTRLVDKSASGRLSHAVSGYWRFERVLPS
jgi:hypothetical protein